MVKIKKFMAAALVFPLMCLCLAGCAGTFKEYEVRSAYVFGGIMPFVFWGHGENVDKAFAEMLAALEKIDGLTNVNRAGESDILNINLAKAQDETEIDFITYDIIRLAKQYYAQTEGACNIAAYPLSYLWGIDACGFTDYQYDPSYQNTDLWTVPQSFKNSDIQRKLPLPDYSEVLRVKEFCDLDKLSVFKDNDRYFAVKQIDELMIDLGGISKGYAADLCAKICEKQGIKSAKIDLSGNLYFVGEYLNQSAWNVGIVFPDGYKTLDDGDDYFCAFEADGGISAVTSGDYQRYRTVITGSGGELTVTHIINCKTGLPYTLTYNDGYENISGGVTSCTVINGVSAFADAYAKAACVFGIERAAEFFEQNGVKAIMFTTDLRRAFTSGAEPVLTDTYGVYKGFTEVKN